MSTANLEISLLAYDDQPESRNPRLRLIDWRPQFFQLQVDLPQQTRYTVSPGQSVTAFDASRPLTSDGTTQYSLTGSALGGGRYRLAWTGTGTDPAFRVDRDLNLAPGTVTLVANANSTVTVTHSVGAVFGAVVAGDTVFVPGASTGDTALFNSLNEGYWSVLSASATTLVLTRPTGSVYQAASEAVVLTDDQQFVAYASTGVEIGDTIDIVSGFATPTRKSYEVVVVTARWVEFVSTVPLAEETVTAGTGVVVYSAPMQFIYAESDQEVGVRINDASADYSRVVPLRAGRSSGVYMQSGTIFKVVLHSRSTASATVTVASWR